MTSEFATCTRLNKRIAQITLSRPERLNALNMEMKHQIETHVRALSDEPDVSVILITGGPTVFVAGTDLHEMSEMTPIDHFTMGTERVFTALRECPKILIAAVDGFALGGGCELALACDIIVASESAKFGQPEIRVGIMPGAGGAQLLLRTVGKYRAMKMALTGEMIDAQQAAAMGIVSDLAPASKATERALELANTIAEMPYLSVLSIKDAMRIGQDAPLSTALAYERRAFQILFASADQKEGMKAFLEKRKPKFSGA